MCLGVIMLYRRNYTTRYNNIIRNIHGGGLSTSKTSLRYKKFNQIVSYNYTLCLIHNYFISTAYVGVEGEE